MVRRIIYYITHWEDWHWLAKYVLILPAWLWYCLKARSFWFFTTSNPSITFGGFTGESKSEIYKQLPPHTYPKTILISPSTTFYEVSKEVESYGFSFPFIVKPNKGMMGFMFRRIDTLQQLFQYHLVMPDDYLIQALVTYPVEVSVFYYRFPNEVIGQITGFVKKEALEVVGDGTHSLKELILNYPRARFRVKELFSKHEGKLDFILAPGERYCLSHALNLSRGGRLVSLAHEKDESLLKIFDGLSHYTKSFFFGRYDIKCASIDDLKKGINFSILEYNGAGAEPHHVYGDGNTLWNACKILVKHWEILFRISRYNHQSGVPYWEHKKGSEFSINMRRYFKKLGLLDKGFEFDKQLYPLETTIVSEPVVYKSTSPSLPRKLSTEPQVA